MRINKDAVLDTLETERWFLHKIAELRKIGDIEGAAEYEADLKRCEAGYKLAHRYARQLHLSAKQG